MKKVFAKNPRFDSVVQVDVGGADDSRPTYPLLAAADPQIGAVLEQAKQFALQFPAHFANFIYEKSASGCNVNQSRPILGNAWTGLSLGAEKLTFQHSGRGCRAAKLDEWRIVPARARVQEPGNDFHACSVLPLNQHGKIVRGEQESIVFRISRMAGVLPKMTDSAGKFAGSIRNVSSRLEGIVIAKSAGLTSFKMHSSGHNSARTQKSLASTVCN